MVAVLLSSYKKREREGGRGRQGQRKELNMCTVVHWGTICYVKELMNATSGKSRTPAPNRAPLDTSLVAEWATLYK